MIAVIEPAKRLSLLANKGTLVVHKAVQQQESHLCYLVGILGFIEQIVQLVRILGGGDAAALGSQ